MARVDSGGPGRDRQRGCRVPTLPCSATRPVCKAVLPVQGRLRQAAVIRATPTAAQATGELRAG